MSRYISVPACLKRFVFAAVLLGASYAQAANNPGTLDDRSDGGGYTDESDGWGRYRVPEGSSTDSNDPRVERRFDADKIDTQYVRTFQARYNIVNADNTTIAQVLNYDADSSDKNKPVVFINAKSDSSTQWAIYNKSTKLFTINKNTSTSRPSFVLKVVSYSKTVNGVLGMYSDIYINGSKKQTWKHERIGDQSTMRYGAYHHGSGTANIMVKDVSFP